MKQYQNYIFDLYGTLVDIHTDEEKTAFWRHMSLFFGYQGAVYDAALLQRRYLELVAAMERESAHSAEKHYAHESYPEIPLEKVFQVLYEEKGVCAGEELLLHTGQMFRALSTEYVRLYANGKELLTALKAAGRGVYLLSNAQRIFTEYELKYLGIYDLFDGILISSEEGCKKPDVRFFELLTSRFGLDKKECLMIGNDLETDIAGAAAAGMDSLYIPSAISPKTQKEGKATYAMKRMNLKALQTRLLTC